MGGCSVETWLLCGDLFKDSNLDVTGIEGTLTIAAQLLHNLKTVISF